MLIDDPEILAIVEKLECFRDRKIELEVMGMLSFTLILIAVENLTEVDMSFAVNRKNAALLIADAAGYIASRVEQTEDGVDLGPV